MKILITGATGFVGGALTKRLAKQGHEIIATGRSSVSRNEIEKHGKFLQWDINNRIDKISVDVCIHAAGRADDQTSYNELYKTNVEGTRNVLESVSCEKFIYISSSSVYDFQSETHTENESINKNKLGNYGRTKYEGEELVAREKDRYRSCTVLRPRVIYGKGDRILIPRVIKQSNKGKIKVPGDLEVRSSFCNIDLLGLSVEKIIASHTGYDIFNVSDVEIYEMKDAVNRILTNYYEGEIEFTHLPLKVLRPLARICDLFPWKTALSRFAVLNLSKEKVLDSRKLYEFLGAKPQQNFNNEIADIIEWYKKAEQEMERKGTNNLAWISTEI